MSDPSTIGALAAWSIGVAAEAFSKGFLGEAAKEAYQAVKNTIAKWARGDLEKLELSPTSAARRAVVAEVVDLRPIDDQESLRLLLEPLVTSLSAQASAIGIDIGTLTNVKTRLGTLIVDEGIGARIGGVLGGSLSVEEIKVGIKK